MRILLVYCFFFVFLFFPLSAQGFAETYPPNPKVVSDMTSLHHIHEAGILYNLGERSKLRNQRPYTFMVSFPAVRAEAPVYPIQQKR